MKMKKSDANYVDLLDEDKPIAQQKFVCVSFVSPENILKQKQQFYFQKFVDSWDLVKSMQKYAQFTAFLAFKYHLDTHAVTNDLTDFCKEEAKNMAGESVTDDYKTFLDKNESSLEAEFLEQNKFQTSVRGIKIRGVYPTQGEAEMRAKLLREVDPNFDVYVGPVGLWMPWEPDAYKTGRVEYLEEELNALMTKKKENEDSAKDYFEQRVKESKRKAIEENMKKAEATGNKLTQTIDKDGSLIGVQGMNTQAMQLEDVTVDGVKKLLFENENVVSHPKR
jgi:Family of unknown function (DUF5832)